MLGRDKQTVVRQLRSVHASGAVIDTPFGSSLDVLPDPDDFGTRGLPNMSAYVWDFDALVR